MPASGSRTGTRSSIAEPAPTGKEKTYTVRAQGRLQTPEEFGQVVVRSNPDGSVVRLKDVARIDLGALNYQQFTRFNGQPGSIIAVFQTPGSNALAVADGVKKTIADLKQRFPADLDYKISLDTTLPVTEGIREIVQTLVIYAITAVLLFVAAGTWRWPQAWIFVIEMAATGIAVGVWLARHDPGLSNRPGAEAMQTFTAVQEFDSPVVPQLSPSSRGARPLPYSLPRALFPLSGSRNGGLEKSL